MLLTADIAARNPTLVGQEGQVPSSAPARGVVRITRHPLLWAILRWAGAHMLARGDAWKRFAAMTSNAPVGAIVQGRNTLALGEIGYGKPLVGLLLYAIVIWRHPLIFGVHPY
jgi:uncharacterized membrane protein